MKTAKASAAAYYLACPECDEDIAAPCGSLMWTKESALTSGAKVRCHSCGAWTLLPRALRPSGPDEARV